MSTFFSLATFSHWAKNWPLAAEPLAATGALIARSVPVNVTEVERMRFGLAGISVWLPSTLVKMRGQVSVAEACDQNSSDAIAAVAIRAAIRLVVAILMAAFSADGVGRAGAVPSARSPCGRQH
ncbi:hypothetical protein D3C71_1640570 [compost metagenome]